jgi:hypothetical protein
VEDIELYYKKINVGKTLTCLLHSFKTEIPCILTDPTPPFKFDEEISNYDFSFLGIDKGQPHQAWDRLCFILSASGMLLFPNNILSHRLYENKIEIFTNNNQKIIVNFDRINIFDEEETGWSYLYDYYDWKSGSLHDVQALEDPESNFVKKIIFYSSERERVNKEVKDLVCISYVRNDEIDDLEVSPTYTRLKTMRMLKENNIKGRMTGYNSKGQSTHTSPVISFNKRIVKPHFKPSLELGDVVNMKISKKGYTWKLLDKIIRTIST